MVLSGANAEKEESSRKRKRKDNRDTVIPSCNEDDEQEESIGKPPLKRAHVCEVCSVAFLKPAHLQQHLVTHLGQRPFTCSHNGCESSFKRQDHLNRHLRAHSHPVLSCPIPGCSVTCTLPDNLRAHLKRHDAMRFSCSQAGCSFQTAFKRELWEHTRSSHQARHMCPEPQCGKVFKFRSLLSTHTASVHGFGAKKMASPESSSDEHGEASASQHSEDAQKHADLGGADSAGPIPTAEGAASAQAGFSCIIPGCNAHFRAKRSLKQHLTVVHLKETRYPCRTSSCPSSFPSEADRARHTAAKHRASLAETVEGHCVHAGKASASKHKADIINIFDQPTYENYP